MPPSTVLVVYTGPHQGVVVPAHGVHAVRGKPVEVTPEVADALTSSPAWKRARKPKKKTEPKPPKADADQG